MGRLDQSKPQKDILEYVENKRNQYLQYGGEISQKNNGNVLNTNQNEKGANEYNNNAKLTDARRDQIGGDANDNKRINRNHHERSNSDI